MKPTERVELTQGKFAVVDQSDFAEISKYNWHFHKGYAQRNFVNSDGKKTTVKMHRQIMNANGNVLIDHINRDKLDNRRCNLRVCNYFENAQNSVAHKDSKSGLKGVSWNKKKNKWRAQIQFLGKKIELGNFKEKLDAYSAYCEASKKLFGQFSAV